MKEEKQNRKLGGSQRNISQNRKRALSSKREGHPLGKSDPCLPGTRLLACPLGSLWAPW